MTKTSEGIISNTNDDNFLCSPSKIAAGMIKNKHETLVDQDHTYESRKVKRKLVTGIIDEAPSKKTKRKKINDKFKVKLIKETDEDVPEIQKNQKYKEIEIKGKKKLSKKEDKIAKIRNSPKVLSKMISSLSQEQQTWVRDAGFGSLLHFDMGKLPQRLAFKVLEAFDAASCILKLQNGDIKITEREVYDVLGLPYQGDKVMIAQDDARHERIIKWREQFPVNNGHSLIKASEVVDRMKQGKNADELFKMNFLIIITNVLIRSNTNNFVSQTILSFDDEFDNCARYNWAAYLINNLVITKERWMHTTSLFYTGPMIFLIKLYVDRVLYKGQKLVCRDKPTFRGWTKGKLKKREAMKSKSGAFGSGAMFESSSLEETGENRRITGNKDKIDKGIKKSQVQLNQDEGNPDGEPHEDWLERLSVKATLLIDAKRGYDSELSNAKNMHPNNKRILDIESKIKAFFQTYSHNNQHVDNECHMDHRGICNLRCDAALVESDFPKEANISQKISYVINKTVQPLSTIDSPGSYSQTPKTEPIFCKKNECVDISSDSSKESGYLGSSPGFDPESDFSPAMQKVYARRQSKKYHRGIYSLRCDSTPIESDFQKEANISQEVSQLTKTVQPLFLNDSPSCYTQTPRSVSAKTVGFFKQLEEQIQENKFDVSMVLPPQIQLDEQIIQEYEKVLKKYLSRRLLDLANDSNLQDFNKVLHFLLACRKIPSHLQQEFLTLRRDLPNLTSRAYELHKEVNRGMMMPLARYKERGELKSILGKYRQVEDNLVNLEKEKDANLVLITMFQTRNERLSEKITNLKAESVKNVVDGCGELLNDKLGKLEQMKDQISNEIVRLQVSIGAIDAKIIKFADEAELLYKDAAAQNYKVMNLESVGAVYEANVRNAMDSLVTMELKWKERVESLDY